MLDICRPIATLNDSRVVPFKSEGLQVRISKLKLVPIIFTGGGQMNLEWSALTPVTGNLKNSESFTSYTQLLLLEIDTKNLELKDLTFTSKSYKKTLIFI